MAIQENDECETSDLQKDGQVELQDNHPPSGSKARAGLYIVATPIGHAQDITLRALDLLRQADTLLCEDTRVTSKLLMIHAIPRKKMMAYHEHNAEKMRPHVLQKISEGEIVVLVSDAGTPLINDPGYKLVRACAEQGLPYTCAPGASSVTSALVLSGLPSDRFLYLGFLPNKSSGRKKVLDEIKNVRATLIILESPRRVAASLKDMAEVLGTREAAVTREMTKKFEEVRRAPLPELAQTYEDLSPRGEIVVVIGPPNDIREITTDEDLDEMILAALKRLSVKDCVAELVEATGLPKRKIYNRAVELTKT